MPRTVARRDGAFQYKSGERRMTHPLSRRSLLALTAGLGASTMLGGGARARARAPKLNTQSPYFHRFELGDAEVTVVSDGVLPLGNPNGTFTGASDDEIKKMLSDNFLTDNIVLEQNSPIVNTGDKLVLFDTGMGSSKLFGPTTGRQQAGRHRRGGVLARPYRPHRRCRR
jgi:hypothetical protein